MSLANPRLVGDARVDWRIARYHWRRPLHSQTPEGGGGLHNVMQEQNIKLNGIVNGIDLSVWSPEVDEHLKTDGYQNYSARTLATGKAACKAALQKEVSRAGCTPTVQSRQAHVLA